MAENENVQELETILYSQVHHKPIIQNFKILNSSIEDPSETSNSTKKRYWNQSTKKNKLIQHNNKSKNKNQYFNDKKLVVNEIENKQEIMSFVSKAYAPYKPILENAIPLASYSTGNNEIAFINTGTNEAVAVENKNDSNINKNISNQNKEIVIKNNQSRKMKNLANNNKNKMAKKPFKEQVEKIDKFKKMLDKKHKAQKSRNNTKMFNAMNPPNVIETICLDQTESEPDSEDVIEVKLPAPPLVTIDSSDSDNLTDMANLSFNAPIRTEIFRNKNQQQQDSSRCNTPGSIFSDDFMAQLDRSSLLMDTEMNANDEDFNFEPVTLSNYIENNGKIKNNESLDMNSIPKQQKNENNKCTDFRVTNENFGAAIDLYQSESDLTESIYSKGSASTSKLLNSSKDIILSSDSENDLLVYIPKSKRFRKRRSSSTNKDSEPNNEESTDSDSNINKNLPFISKGEAVEKCKILLPKKPNTKESNPTISNGSDTEFIVKLNSIVKGRATSDNDSSDDTITARTIAEDVLYSLSNDKLQIDEKTSEENILNKNYENIADNKNKTGTQNSINNYDNQKNIVVAGIKNDKKSTVTSTVTSNDSSLISLSELIEPLLFAPPPVQKASPVQKGPTVLRSSPVQSTLVAKTFTPPPPVPLPRPAVPSTSAVSSTSTVPSTSAIQSSAALPPPPPPPRLVHKDILNAIKLNEASELTEIYSIFHKSGPDLGWTEEQQKFYNSSWGGENFNVNKIKKSMDRNARWTIFSEDRFPKHSKKSNLKCNNCSDFGHMQSKCPQSRKPIVCYMCGQNGHKEPRCPNTICLKCGNKTRVFTKMCNSCVHQSKQVCSLCKVRGHTYEFCTDRWRRYHSTTTSNTNLNDNIVYNKEKFCCICSQRGHLSQNCKSAYRFSEYPLTPTEIKSYSQSYKNDSNEEVNRLSDSIQYNLLFKPDPSIQFSFSRNTKFTENQFYGRFLKATKLVLSNDNNNSNNQNIIEISGENAMVQPREQEVVPKQSALNNENIYQNIEFIECGSEANSKLIPHNSNVEENPRENPRIFSKNDEFKNDSDSNYSFSEHFDITTDNLTNDSEKSPDSYNTDSYPDFILLNDELRTDNGNLEEDMKHFKNGVEVITHDDENANTVEEHYSTTTPCVAKILLKRNCAEYLLSADGNKYLIESSFHHNVKASIEWHQIGNVLLFEGLRKDQDMFYADLLKTFHKLDNNIIKNNDDNLRIPRKRIALIRFLTSDILSLQQNYGDVNDLKKQLNKCERQNSNKSLKLADKLRRNLNVILFGQTGLKEGKKHLITLMQNVRDLNSTTTETVEKDLREIINNSWRYIFSSKKHDNYDEVINKYYALKINNALPKLQIDPSALRKRNNNNNNNNNNNTTKFNNVTDNLNKFKFNKTAKCVFISGRTNEAVEVKNAVLLDDIRKLNKKQQIEQCAKVLNEITKDIQVPNNRTNSSFWSTEATKLLQSYREKYEPHTELHSKMKLIHEKANLGLLTYNDYRALVKLQNFVF